MFARVRVPLGEPHAALLVAERAVGTDQGRKFVYVVNDKNEVVDRTVILGPVHNGLRVIAEGLKSGERIIIDGLQRVRPGAEVNAKPADMKSRPGSAVAKATAETAGDSEPAESGKSPGKSPAKQPAQ
jgi:multidrug efflux pump subunit AcrA (membrane-fusion protein)